MSEIRTEPKKLVDLNPRWVNCAPIRPEPLTNRRGYFGCTKGGIEFDCPCGEGLVAGSIAQCRFGPTITLYFENPVLGQAWPYGRGVLWHRTGETFETLTLSPSIHCVGHWHGYLRNGMLISV